MTDRIKSLTVVLDNDYRDDDVTHIVEAIQMIRGVASVEQHVTNFEDYEARRRVRHDLGRTLMTVWQAVLDGKEVRIVEPEKP